MNPDLPRELEVCSFEEEKISDMLTIYMEFIEEEGMGKWSLSKNREDLLVGTTCFFNRLPMFHNLLYIIKEKIEAQQKQLEQLTDLAYEEKRKEKSV